MIRKEIVRFVARCRTPGSELDGKSAPSILRLAGRNTVKRIILADSVEPERATEENYGFFGIGSNSLPPEPATLSVSASFIVRASGL